jgi:hypothetical protein
MQSFCILEHRRMSNWNYKVWRWLNIGKTFGILERIKQPMRIASNPADFGDGPWPIFLMRHAHLGTIQTVTTPVQTDCTAVVSDRLWFRSPPHASVILCTARTSTKKSCFRSPPRLLPSSSLCRRSVPHPRFTSAPRRTTTVEVVHVCQVFVDPSPPPLPQAKRTTGCEENRSPALLHSPPSPSPALDSSGCPPSPPTLPRASSRQGAPSRPLHRPPRPMECPLSGVLPLSVATTKERLLWWVPVLPAASNGVTTRHSHYRASSPTGTYHSPPKSCWCHHPMAMDPPSPIFFNGPPTHGYPGHLNGPAKSGP